MKATEMKLSRNWVNQREINADYKVVVKAEHITSENCVFSKTYEGPPADEMQSEGYRIITL